jgi:hypothetical protein
MNGLETEFLLQLGRIELPIAVGESSAAVLDRPRNGDDRSRAAGSDMTDEASAIETLGLAPRLVESDSRNLKVTYPQDLELASLILRKMHE